jgi:hypothetical protein
MHLAPLLPSSLASLLFYPLRAALVIQALQLPLHLPMTRRNASMPALVKVSFSRFMPGGVQVRPAGSRRYCAAAANHRGRQQVSAALGRRVFAAGGALD